MAITTDISCPNGTRGTAVAPWSPNEWYAVAAAWSQAAAPVYEYGKTGWISTQYQVADFRHSDTAALRMVLREALEASGDTDEDDIEEQIDGYLEDAVDLLPEDLHAIAVILELAGDRYTGNDVEDEAKEWADHGFDSDAVSEWVEVGVWDAATAAEFRDAGMTPDNVSTIADRLTDAEMVDCDPIYAACNGDISCDVLIDAHRHATR